MQELQKYYETRYDFENKLLPDWFYGAEKDELQEIGNRDASFVWNKWKLVCEEARLEVKDAKNPFKASKRTIDTNCTIMRIDMPTPDRQPLCFHVFLVWSDDCERREYFTVERGVSSKERYLCSWKDGRRDSVQASILNSWTDGREHRNYGKCSSNAIKVEKRIGNIFAGRSPDVLEKWRRLCLFMSSVVCIGTGIVLYVRIKRLL